MDLRDVSDQFLLVVTHYGMSFFGAIVILIAGFFLSRKIPDILSRLMTSRGVDATVSGFLGNLLKFAILIVTILLVLAQFGVQTASLVAILGAAGLAIGLALQGTLSNVAGGVMLLIFRPIRVGQVVAIGSHTGTVKSLTLFTTELATPDNIQVIIPNGSVWGSAIYNYSYHATRRHDLTIRISYDDDIDRARTIILGLLEADARIHKTPPPLVEVSDLADNSVNLIAQFWCDGSNFGAVKFTITKGIKQAFDAEGISIPYQQRIVQRVRDI